MDLNRTAGVGWGETHGGDGRRAAAEQRELAGASRFRGSGARFTTRVGRGASGDDGEHDGAIVRERSSTTATAGGARRPEQRGFAGICESRATLHQTRRGLTQGLQGDEANMIGLPWARENARRRLAAKKSGAATPAMLRSTLGDANQREREGNGAG